MLSLPTRNKYHFEAKVLRHVVDDVTLTIEAEGREEARQAAILALETFPRVETEEEAYIPFLYTENREVVRTELISLDRRLKKDQP